MASKGGRLRSNAWRRSELILMVAVSWLVFRPVMGILLLAVSGGLGFLYVKRVKKKKAEKAGVMPDAVLTEVFTNQGSGTMVVARADKVKEQAA